MADMTRRQLFRMNPLNLLREAIQPPEKNELKNIVFRPPGALKEPEAFENQCERCGKCAEACTYDAILKSGPETGALENTPYLLPEKSPCRWCTEFDCITACPSGALTKEENAQPAKIGIAVLNLSNCLVPQGTLCDDCLMFCPPGVNAVTLKARQPEISADLCTGCGLCAYHCDAEPNAIKIVQIEKI